LREAAPAPGWAWTAGRVHAVNAVNAVNPPSVAWDAAEADALVGAALAVEHHTDDRGRWPTIGRLADAVDAAYLAHDLPRLRTTVAEYRTFLGTADEV
jgi:hypothetical protein